MFIQTCNSEHCVQIFQMRLGFMMIEIGHFWIINLATECTCAHGVIVCKTQYVL